MTNISQRKLYPWPERDPLIDVIERGRTVRVIVVLPRITAEDVWFTVKNGVMVVEISKYGQIFRKESPCKSKGCHLVLIRSAVHNSVLEAVFNKVPQIGTERQKSS